MIRKRIVFEELDKNHADLVIKLRSMGISQKDFFQGILRAYIDDDPNLDEFFEGITQRYSKLGKAPREIVRKAQKQGKILKNSFSLTDEEKENIFDILELENFD